MCDLPDIYIEVSSVYVMCEQIKNLVILYTHMVHIRGLPNDGWFVPFVVKCVLYVGVHPIIN